MISISSLTPALEETSCMKFNKTILKDFVIEFLTNDGKPISKGRNNLLNKAKGSYVLWIDSDIKLSEGIIQELIKHVKGDVIGVAASALTVANNWKNSLKRIEENVFRHYAPRVHIARSCMFECSLFKKEPLLEVGGFDTRFNCGEDNDLCERLLAHGFKLIKLKDLIVSHYYNSSNIKKKMRDYGVGEKMMNDKYEGYELRELPIPARSKRWVRRFIEAFAIGKLHLLPLLPFFNLYCRINWRLGYAGYK